MNSQERMEQVRERFASVFGRKTYVCVQAR